MNRTNEYGVDVGYFARKVDQWAREQSYLLGRDVTFFERPSRWPPDRWKHT